MARKDELLKQCEELNIINTVKKSRHRKDKDTGEYYFEPTILDLEEAVQRYFLDLYEKEGRLNIFVKDILTIDSPMLALQSKDKKLDNIRDKLWEDCTFNTPHGWIYQEKIDGCRCLLCWDKDKGFDFFSRNKSITDSLPISYGTKLLVPQINPEVLINLGIYNFIVDTEIVPYYNVVNPMKDGTPLTAETPQNLTTSILGSLDDLSHRMQETNPLKFMIFDILKLNNNWMIDTIEDHVYEIKHYISENGEFRTKEILLGLLKNYSYEEQEFFKNTSNHKIKKEPYINVTFRDRYKKVLQIYKLLSFAGFGDKIQLISSTCTNKQAFYNQIINEGGEGVVAKDLDSGYEPWGKRRGEWVKLKRTITQSLLAEKIGDTVDAFVTGFKEGNVGTSNEGLVGALEFSIYLTDEENNYLYDEYGNPIIHHIATISGMTDELRKMISIKDENGNVALLPKVYGSVAEIHGQDISSKNLRFAHAIFKGWRPDRAAESCKMRKSTLENLIL